MTDDHPLADEAFMRRLQAMETRLRYLNKTEGGGRWSWRRWNE